MATIERRTDHACPKPVDHDHADPVVPRNAGAEPVPPADEPDYFFWGINELYVAP
ncbi:MAG: hypothetical protein JWL96_774 [Sphingomonas bacterium]|uniref:hypothetical protein n=1 Tax=Sphingomonas bacterium TaxID=1895847 RepID=UPI00262392B4|nr:hypothetical protein [Sphingomonas bacterium]MDB5708704.1 hypothetical protein [Sphingomonas bacterium]